MTKIIDGKDAVLGRLATYVAKEAMKGEEIVILNSEQVIITGNKTQIKKDFLEKRTKIGSGQKGPKYSRSSDKIVKRAIRGMLPNHRHGRGRDAFNRIRCYVGIPEKFKESKKITFEENENKHIKIGEIFK
ncbi:50S ribosomal protein L13 [Candidatus Pacearchaeota archaeon]|nr:50S ribosomal protein L13 [Candidatus Pacearchaeota archaeon]